MCFLTDGRVVGELVLAEVDVHLLVRVHANSRVPASVLAFEINRFP